MGYNYTPTYYSSLHDSITSICKNILPFSFKKRRLLAAEKQQSKQQSDNLKWQQDSFHRILNLMGLQKEGILPESELASFRTKLLETLIASRAEHEQPVILRDKLLFLQELLYANCISNEEYHASKRPLLQRLAVQGAEIDARDLIVGTAPTKGSEEEWSVIDLKDEQNSLAKENSNSKNKSKHAPAAAIKHQLKGAASIFGLGSSQKQGENREERSIFDQNSKGDSRSAGRRWGFDGFKKLRINSNMDDEPKAPSIWEGSDGPNTQKIKEKMHSDGSSSDFFIDKILGDNIKKELSRIQNELSSTNPNLQFSNDQIEAISTKLPVDKADLKKFFPKSWCDQYGDVVLDVVKKEFKEHVGEMENMSATRGKHPNSKRWTTFEDDDENNHPNLRTEAHANSSKRWTTFEDSEKCFSNNPFLEDQMENKVRNESVFLHDHQNPFWIPGHRSSMLG